MITLKINGVDFEVIKVDKEDEDAIVAFLPDMETMSWKPHEIPFWDVLFFTTNHSLGSHTFDESDYIVRIPSPQKKGDKYLYTMMPSDIFKILKETCTESTQTPE